MISTNLPASEFDRFMSLALKARGQKVSTLSLVPPTINPADPDIAEIQDKVATAIDHAEGDAPPAKTKKRKRARSPVARSARATRATPPTTPRTSAPLLG